MKKCAPTYLVQIIHKHLAHLINWNGCIYGAVEATLANQVWQCTKVVDVRECEEHSVDLMNVPTVKSQWCKDLMNVPTVRSQWWKDLMNVPTVRSQWWKDLMNVPTVISQWWKDLKLFCVPKKHWSKSVRKCSQGTSRQDALKAEKCIDVFTVLTKAKSDWLDLPLNAECDRLPVFVDQTITPWNLQT